MRFNNTNKRFVVQDHSYVNSNMILPRMVFCDEITKQSSIFDEFNSSIDAILLDNPSARICLYRSYAMGDMIMLLPIIHYIKDKYRNVNLTLCTSEKFFWIFKNLGIQIISQRNLYDVNNYDYIFMLDGCLERDHNIEKYKRMHRVENYAESLGINFCDIKPNYSSNIATNKIECKDNGKKNVLLQLRGSTEAKNLNKDTLQYICNELSKKYNIYPTDYSKGFIKCNNDDLMGQGIMTVYNFMSNIDCAITFDSGLLWMSHMTETPVVCIIGPTFPESRLSFSPMNIEHIDLSKKYGCKNRCSEATIDNFACMKNVDKEWLAKQLEMKIDVVCK